jgi:hypothetical protein
VLLISTNRRLRQFSVAARSRRILKSVAYKGLEIAQPVLDRVMEHAEVTAALDSMLEQHCAQMGPVVKSAERWILLVQKVRDH